MKRVFLAIRVKKAIIPTQTLTLYNNECGLTSRVAYCCSSSHNCISSRTIVSGYSLPHSPFVIEVLLGFELSFYVDFLSSIKPPLFLWSNRNGRANLVQTRANGILSNQQTLELFRACRCFQYIQLNNCHIICYFHLQQVNMQIFLNLSFQSDTIFSSIIEKNGNICDYRLL